MICSEGSEIWEAAAQGHGTAQHNTSPRLFNTFTTPSLIKIKRHRLLAPRNLTDMSCSLRHITNALAHLRREQCLRHPAATVAFAGSAGPPGTRASCPRRFDVHWPSRGSIRSYARKHNREPATVEELDETIDAKEKTTPLAHNTIAFYLAAKRGAEQLNPRSKSITDAIPELKPRRPAVPEPEVRFGQSDATSETPWSRDSGISLLEGYTSEAENIKLYLNRRKPGVEDRSWVKLSKLYLRDTCQCSKCVSPSSGRKTFATCDVPTVPRLRDPDSESIRLKTDGSLEITWEDDFLTGDKHTSVYPREFLERLIYNDGAANYASRPRRLFWDKATFQHDMESRAVTYSGWMEGDTEFAVAVMNLFRHGLLFMRGVPKSRHSVQRIAEKIGVLQSTMRGLTWDVISQPGAEHAAGNNRHLGLHQDLLYCQTPPRIKFLHCLENECEGGVSLFSDGLNAASVLEWKDWRNYNVLQTQHVTYWYQRAGHCLEMRRPVIDPGPSDGPKFVSWSPAFQGPFRVAEHKKILALPSRRGTLPGLGTTVMEALPAWSKAAGAFRDILESPENVVKYRLQPGDCVILDNKRVLHGRTEVDASAGLRHLRGAYVDGQALHSTFVNLATRWILRRMRCGTFPASTDLFQGLPQVWALG
ncbi:Gamma-butyrobetaine dioxygenase [Diaporthe eres]|nr:Gamma-butyrobetaine dioxygenase [Diaporthe eres]